MPIRDIQIISDVGSSGGVVDTFEIVVSPSLFTIQEMATSSFSKTVLSLFSNNDVVARLVTKRNGVVVGSSAINPSNLTFSKSELTVADALSCAGLIENKIRIWVSYSDYSAPLDVVLDYKKPVKVELTVSDPNILYRGTGEYFSYDSTAVSVTKAKITYNDGTYMNENNPTCWKARVPNPSDAPDYLRGIDVIPQADSVTIYFGFSTSNTQNVSQDTNTYNFVEEHELTILDSPIVSYVFTSQPSSIMLGCKLEHYKNDFVLVGIDENNQQHVLNNYSFADNNYILSGSSISSITVVVGGTNETIILDDPIPLETAIVDKIVYPRIKTSYEEDETFDFRDLTFLIKYVGTDYTETAVFGTSFSVELRDGNTTVLTGQSNFDGTATLGSLGIDSTNSGQKLRFTISTTLCSDVIIATLNVFEIDNIVSLEMANVYTEYNVGDKFLKEDDDTTVVIRYKDSNDNLKSKTIRLNSGYDKLITTPRFGETLNKIELNKEVVVSSAFDSNVNTTYLIDINPQVVSDNSKVISCWAMYSDSFAGYTPKNGLILLMSYDEDDSVVGYIENINDPNQNAKLVLLHDYMPDIERTSNIEIQFPYYVEDAAEDINKCTFGVLFGANNAHNRLFLSGNPDVGNADWHSEEPSYIDTFVSVKPNGDFSYFSDESVMYYGETDNDVIGYEVVSNDKLLVLKNKSDKEKTVYFRNPTLVRALDAAGTEMKDVSNNSTYREEFSLTKGNNSVAGISPKSIVNFNGQTLFLDSNNQLVGLDVVGIVGDNQRYANTRSQYIDKVLEKLDLSDAIVWTNNTYLFIAIKDFGIFATQFRTYDSETKQYEWFYLTSEDPTVFLEKDDVIYFANDQGTLYKYVDGCFMDIKKVFSDYTLRYSTDGKLIVSKDVVEEIDSRSEEDFKFRSLTPKDADYKQKIFYKVALMSDNIANGEQIEINNTGHFLETDLELKEKTDYYLDGYRESNVAATESDLQNVIGVKFRVKQLEPDGLAHGNRYHLYKIVDGEEVKIDITSFNNAKLCCCVEDEEVDISEYHIKETDSVDEYNTITLARDGSNIELVRYGAQLDTHLFKSEIKSYKNVEAFYIVAPFVFGSLDRFKTIWSYTITNDSGIPSEIEVAYASNKLALVETRKMSYISLTKEAMGISLENLSFQKIDLDKVVVPRTYTFHRVLSRQKFICFAFRNFNNTDAVLSSMSVDYSLPFPSVSGD